MTAQGFSLPQDTVAIINAYFRSRERCLIALELLNYDHSPLLDERRELAQKYGTDVSTVGDVVDALERKNLFTEAQGGIPLYRYKLDREHRL